MMLEAYFYKKNIAEILKNVIKSKGDNTFNVYSVSYSSTDRKRPRQPKNRKEPTTCHQHFTRKCADMTK